MYTYLLQRYECMIDVLAMQLTVSTLNASLTMQPLYHQDRTMARPFSVMPNPAVDVAAADKRFPHCSSEKESGATETSIQMF